MRRISFVLIALIFVCAGLNHARAESSMESAVSAARDWLSDVDGGSYAESWHESSAYFRGLISEDNWRASVEKARKPMGRLLSRELLTAEEPAAIPGAPDGRYVVMSFAAAFEHKKSARETVTFMLDVDGKWRAAGYFIK
jgi:hypothetical protein